jgi:hypothetical protein
LGHMSGLPRLVYGIRYKNGSAGLDDGALEGLAAGVVAPIVVTAIAMAVHIATGVRSRRISPSFRLVL